MSGTVSGIGQMGQAVSIYELMIFIIVQITGMELVFGETGGIFIYILKVPEPSTYMMVTGLLMVPGMSYYRRLRKKKDPDGIEENQEL